MVGIVKAQNVPPSGIQSSQLLTMRDDPIHRDLVLENVSSIPIFPHIGHPLLSQPTSNKAAGAGMHLFNPAIVTPTTIQSKSHNQQLTIKSSGI